jgi:hypothetical protein
MVASSLATTTEDENISSAPRMLHRPGISLIIIHLRVSDSQIFGRATLQQRIAEFRLFHPEVRCLM